MKRVIDNYRQSLVVALLYKIVQVGVKMLEKQDLMLNKMNVMLQKKDERAFSESNKRRFGEGER